MSWDLTFWQALCEGIVLIVLDRFTEDFCAMFLLCYDLVPWWTKSPFMMFHEDLLDVLGYPVAEKHAEPRWSFPCRFGTQPSLHLSQTPQLWSQMCQAFDLPDSAFLATLSVWYPAMTSNPPTKQPKLFLNSVVQSVRYFHVLLALSFYFHTWECDCDWLGMEHDRPCHTAFLTDMFGCLDGTKMMCTIYWTLDIGASLSTAVFVNGKLVTERRVIIRQCEAQMSGWSSACRSQTMHRVYASESYYNLQAFICQLSEFVLFFSLLSDLVFLHLLGCFPYFWHSVSVCFYVQVCTDLDAFWHSACEHLRVLSVKTVFGVSS